VDPFIGVGLYFIVDWFPQYETLTTKQKRLVFAAVCLLVPLLGVALGVASGFQEPVWESTFWPALVAAGTAFAAGTVAHVREL